MAALSANKTDLASRARLRARQTPIELVKTPGGAPLVRERVRTRSSAEEVVNAFLSVIGSDARAQLENIGVTVNSVRGGIALCSFPQGLLPEIEALDYVKSVRVESPVAAKLDMARAATNIDKVHEGEGLPQAYTGKGVVAGIVDGGFDPNHVNFQEADGTYRIKQMTIHRLSQGGNIEKSQLKGEELKKVDTDDAESFHGTHTMGIMAGGYRDNIKIGNAIDFINGEVKDVSNPYYGVAYEADIVAGGALDGNLTDAFIAYGVESIVDYAWDHQQPTAINISLGSNVGPHDGSSMICQYLDAIVADDQVNTIVCLAAGNEGDQPIAINKRFTADETTVASFIHPRYNQIQSGSEVIVNPRAGTIYIYSDTAEPFDLQAIVYNKSRKVAAARYAISGNPEGVMQYWVSDNSWQQDSSDKIDAQLAKYFNGYVGLIGELDSESGRYLSVIDFTLFDAVSQSNKNGNYIIGFQITGKDGQRVDIYGDGGWTILSGEGQTGYTDGGFDGTINDIACGNNTVVVGAYTTRNYWGSLDGQVYGYWDVIPKDQMTGFTSYGTLIDGRTLPHICAPGAAIISSSSKPYLDAAQAGDIAIQARVAKNNRMNEWHQSVGTSMAAPVVTGTMCLWLEANPELKASEAREIMMRTAQKDDMVTGTGNPIQWGAGRLDAYEGLKEVLRLKNSGVEDITTDNTGRMQVRRSGNRRFDILVPGCRNVTANVFSIAGTCVMHQNANGNELTLDCSALQPGVYVVKVNNSSIKLAIN